MQPDDKICYCYGVTMRKLIHFAQRTRPQRASRMTECLGAGTGCGWCIPLLSKIADDPDAFHLDDMDADAYAARRSDYIRTKQPRNTFHET
ncbi:MAG: (2Fe-2S)-binding protein [Phycisphaerae bacterium]